MQGSSLRSIYLVPLARKVKRMAELPPWQRPRARPQPRIDRLRSTLRLLYHGHSPMALRFQFAVLIVDLAIIAFFIIAPIWQDRPSFLWLDYAVAALLLADIVARALASTDLGRWLRQPTTIVDILILVTLLAPTWLANLGFLRVLRLWTLSRSGFLWRPLRQRGLAPVGGGDARGDQSPHLPLRRDGVRSTPSSSAQTERHRRAIVDALYFAVTSVTTTGFGDITLPGTWGKLTRSSR